MPRKSSRHLVLLASGLAGAALAAVLAVAPYARNFLAFDIADPERVLDAGKYAPLERVAGAGEPVPLPQLAGAMDATVAAELDALAARTETFALLVGQDESLVYSFRAAGVGEAALLDSFSIHKGLLSVAFGHAVESGAVASLDSPAADFLPEWRGDPRATITIRDLLANQSGLAQASFANRPLNPVLDLFIGRNLARLTFARNLDYPPGSAFDFNHANAQALYFVLIRATGRRYAELVSQYLWKPLGNEPGFVALDRAGGDARAICCFLATAPSWLRFGLMLAADGVWQGGRVVAPQWLAELRRPVAHNPSAGLGLWLVEPFTGQRLQSGPRGVSRDLTGPFTAADTFFFEASGDGRLYVIPSLRVAIVRFGRLRGAWLPFDDAALVNTVVRGLARGRT